MNVFRRLFTPKSETNPPIKPGTKAGDMAGKDSSAAATASKTALSASPDVTNLTMSKSNISATVDPLVIQEAGLPVIAKPELNIIEPQGADKLNITQPALPEMPVSLATRQLPTQDSTKPKPNSHLLYGFASDPGHVRMNNEDALAAFFFGGYSADQQPDLSLFVIADGMGGRDNGEQASALAVRTLSQQIIKNIYLDLLGSGGEVRESSADRPPITEVVSSAVQSANMTVAQKVPDGGTTLTSALIIGDMAYFGHVGDSRAYLITASAVEQVTRDHSLVQRLIELEQLTPEEAETHSQRNVLYRALGQGANLEIDTSVRRLPPNSFLMLCSDGLWNMVPQELIAQLVRGGPTLQESCDRLIQAANQRGGSDNISVILIQTPA